MTEVTTPVQWPQKVTCCGRMYHLPCELAAFLDHWLVCPELRADVEKERAKPDPELERAIHEAEVNELITTGTLEYRIPNCS